MDLAQVYAFGKQTLAIVRSHYSLTEITLKLFTKDSLVKAFHKEVFSKGKHKEIF